MTILRRRKPPVAKPLDNTQTSSEKVKTFLPALTYCEQLRSNCSAILTSIDAVIACKAEIAGVFGEAVVGWHMGRSRAAPLGPPERDIRIARSSTSFGKMELPRRPLAARDGFGLAAA